MPDDESYDYSELPDGDQRDFLYENLGFGEQAIDQDAHDLFWQVYYNDELSIPDRDRALADLNDYLWEAYGIDFEALWDWEDFRAWYESQ